MNLLIISHTPHYQSGGQVVGWGPTVREIDHLAALFTGVEHLAPLHADSATDSALPYTQNNIQFTAVDPAGGDRLWDKLAIFLHVPRWLKTIRSALHRADVLHIRCPAGISLVGLLAARLWGRGKPCWVKYAGSWQPGGKKPLSYRLQRWLIEKNWHQGLVTINGHWPGQPRHVHTFNNPSLTQAEYNQAANHAQEKKLTLPVHLLFVGRVDRAKGVHYLLQIALKLKQARLPFELTLVGDSPERPVFEAYVQEQQLADQVRFAGWQRLTDLPHYYQQAHLFLFPSRSEGWPKVLSEAMAHGVVPIASTVGSIPQTLAKVGAGKAIPSHQVADYTDAIQNYAHNPGVWAAERDQCIQAGVRYTYQAYLEDVQNMFQQAWQIELKP